MIRGDGQVDFIGVGLGRGTNRLRVRMINSWDLERWDSLAVHVTGAPASFALLAETIALPADGVTIRETRVRVLDAWGVPVVNRPFVTVATGQAEVVDLDKDSSSVGRQLLPGPDGWLTIRIRAASEQLVDVLTPAGRRRDWRSGSSAHPEGAGAHDNQHGAARPGRRAG